MVGNREEWVPANFKSLRHPNNKKFITARMNIINKRKVLNLSLGLDVCKEINFKANDRVYVLLNKENRNYLMIKKELGSYEGYKLNFNEKGNSSFLTFSIRYDSLESFRLSQTIVLDYDFRPDVLLVNLGKLKWTK